MSHWPIITITMLSSLWSFCSSSVKVVNGVQPTRHENGLSTKVDTANFEDIIELTNHGNATNSGPDRSESSIATKPILAFESDESFLKKTGAIKPQHVTGTV